MNTPKTRWLLRSLEETLAKTKDPEGVTLQIDDDASMCASIGIVFIPSLVEELRHLIKLNESVEIIKKEENGNG